MTQTRSTRHRRRIERRRRGIVLLMAVGVLVADIVTAASGVLDGPGHHKSGGGQVATAAAPGGVTVPTTSTSTTSPSTTSTTLGRPATNSASGGYSNGGGGATTGSGGTTTGSGGGCGNGACVTLNAAQTTGAFSHAAAGINELPGAPDPAALRELGTNMYRSTPSYRDGQIDWSGWDAAVTGGARTTLILSTLWAFHATQSPPPTPWSDWNAYNSWVKSVAATVLATGQEVDYWDIFNEPGWHGQYSQSDFDSETISDLLQQFQNAYEDIKAVIPSAQIVGPSIGLMLFSPIPTNSVMWETNHEFDITTFLDFCAQHNLQLAAVAWHQNGAPPGLLETWAAQLWTLIRSLPAIGHPVMYLDEYAASPMQPVPGWDVGYLAAIAAENVTYSVRSCWDGCEPATLDGLLLPGGATTSSWVERVTYAQMSGQTITASSTDPNVWSLGAVSTGAVTALIGRMQGCGSPASWCNKYPYPWFGTFPAESVGVTVVLPWTAPNINIKLSHLSSEPGTAVSAATADSPTNVRLSPAGSGQEQLSFSIPSFADGNAYILNVSEG